jgi:hypothetical protein
MLILVACEESQVVTKAFRDKGHEAFSCDIQTTSGGHPEWHIQDDVTKWMHYPWDMIIAFPPCTHLASSGAAWFEQKRKDGRQQEGIDFFMLFTQLDCSRVAIENPVGIMSGLYRRPDQYIHPHMFGHPTTKKTALWLKGLPCLQPTNPVEPLWARNSEGAYLTDSKGKRYSKMHWDTGRMHPHERAKARSKTFQGIADAMADQWSF